MDCDDDLRVGISRAKIQEADVKLILVVDDDQDVRETLADTLIEAGYRVVSANNGRAALLLLEKMTEDPCLVLLDIMMPEMTGVQLLVELAKTGRLARTPVVVLSAQSEDAKGLGARRLMRKPVSGPILLAAVRDVCGPP